MWRARWTLVSLWLSQVARVAADNTLRFFIVLHLRFAADSSYHVTAWYVITAIFMAPMILLAPLNGAITNSLPKPAVLTGSATYGLVVTAVGLFAVIGGGVDHLWLVCWAVVSLGAAIYGPTRYALLPAAAQDTHWPLSRINGLFEMGTAAAIVAGLVLSLSLFETSWLNYPALALLVVGFNAAALFFALPVRFPSDVRRPEPAGQAVRSFFADLHTIWCDRESRVCMVGLALLRGAIYGLVGALMPRVLGAELPSFEHMVEIGTWNGWVMAGFALGSVLAGLHGHPRRVLGVVPWGAVGLVIAMAWAASGDIPGPALLAAFGVAAGLVNTPLAATYQAELPADARGNGMAARNFADYLVVAITSIALYVLAGPLGAPPGVQAALIAAGCGVATLYAWWFYRRETAELLFEGMIAPFYRFEASGPGLDTFPRQGPVLVIANHSSWLDPPWLAKLLPRPVIPMMTSIFFDLPVLRWMMVHLAHAIRVQAGGFRRDVPELREAIATLDRGECLLVFPEGSMRRSDDVPLRMFGQGVWHILRERPETPVVVCWIEGGWGSFFSYRGGPPSRNKRIDLRRPIRVAVGAPQRISPDLLADQRHTRIHLMEACLAMRSHLGLDPVSLKPEEAEATDV